MQLKKYTYVVAGLLFMGLAYIGILLPGVPAIPFILLSAWFFIQSSEKWYNWLLQQKIIGNILRKYFANGAPSKWVIMLVISQLWVSLIVAQVIFHMQLIYMIILNIAGVAASIFLYRFMRRGDWWKNNSNTRL